MSLVFWFISLGILLLIGTLLIVSPDTLSEKTLRNLGITLLLFLIVNVMTHTKLYVKDIKLALINSNALETKIENNKPVFTLKDSTYYEFYKLINTKDLEKL
jgi:hypothetical protein